MIENMWILDDEGTSALPGSPKKIVEVQCDFIREATNYEIKAQITPYSGPIRSYMKPSFSNAIKSSFIFSDDKFVDIQEDLGDIGSRYFTFEFFISSPSVPNYKYRIMFMQYEIGYYPLFLVLDDEIAEEIISPLPENVSNGLSNQNVLCENEADFIKLLKKVIASQKVRKVITSLKRMATSSTREC